MSPYEKKTLTSGGHYGDSWQDCKEKATALHKEHCCPFAVC